MTAAKPTPPNMRRSRGIATLLLGFSAIAIWQPVLGAGVWWGAPMVVLAAAVVAKLLPVADNRVGVALIGVWVVWTPAVMLFTGLPASMLSPTEWFSTASALTKGIGVGLRDGGANPLNPWLLPAWLGASTALWLYGAKQATRPGPLTTALSFFLLALPFALELALQRSDDAAWHGAIVLAAALLWATRGGLRAAVPGIAGVCLMAVLVAAFVGPTQRWASVGGGPKPALTSLDAKQTYGPDPSEKSGKTMFEITAPEPTFWRMQVLDWFSGFGWEVGDGPDDLPQPAAVKATTKVLVRAFRDSRVAAPGRVVSATSGSRETRELPGGSVELTPTLGPGDTYSSVSEVVRPTPEQLTTVKVPKAGAYPRYTQVWNTTDLRTPGPVALEADTMTPAQASTGWGQVIAKARELSRDSSSQYEVVGNVVNYLKASGRFRYSLKVEKPGRYPLIDFLTYTHVGYCQHFAGAAALLLRMAGVPTRVVVGFAPGTPVAAHTSEVKDVDAHAWIEVYYPGYGWVPSDPTAPGSAATITPQADPLSAQIAAQQAAKKTASVQLGSTGGAVLGGLVLLAALAGGIVWWLRRRRNPRPPMPMAEVLVQLVPGPYGVAMTLSELRPELAALGPHVVALADETERQRFGLEQLPVEPRPRRRAWRALRKDVGWWRATRLILFGAGRRPITWTPAAVAAPAVSVAPPGSGSAPPPGG